MNDSIPDCIIVEIDYVNLTEPVSIQKFDLYLPQ